MSSITLTQYIRVPINRPYERVIKLICSADKLIGEISVKSQDELIERATRNLRTMAQKRITQNRCKYNSYNIAEDQIYNKYNSNRQQ